MTDDEAKVTIQPRQLSQLGVLAIGLWKCKRAREREVIRDRWGAESEDEDSGDEETCGLDDLGVVLETKAK